MIRLIAAFLLVAGCGGAYSTDVIPTLPGDGTANVAKPSEPATTKTPAGEDAWSGRDDLIAAPEPNRAAAIALPPIETFKLPNGLEVIYLQAEDARTTHVRLAVRAGRSAVSRDKIGLASFVAAMLTRGTRTRNAAALKNLAETTGVSVTATSSFEASLVSCVAPADALSTCLTLAADVASAPSFPAKGVDEVRNQLISASRRQRQDGGSLASLQFQDVLWGDEHQFGWPASEASVSGITRADLVAFHRSWYRPNNAFLIVSGPEKLATIKPGLTQAFSAWPRANTPKVTEGKAPELAGIKVRLVDRPGPQAHVRVGHFGIKHTDEVFAPAMVVNRVLGEGRASRLVGSVKGGQASSSFDRNSLRGSFTAGAATRPEDAVAAARTILGEIRRLNDEGPSDTEIERAVSTMVGEYVVGLESTAALVDALVTARLHGFDAAYVRDFGLQIAKVTPAVARAAARSLLSSADVVVVIEGSADVIEPKLGEAGWKYEKVSAFAPIGVYEEKKAEEAEAAATAVLDKALEAKGGYDKLSKLKTLQWSGSGTISLGGQSAPVVMTKQYVAPDKLRLNMDINQGAFTVTTVYDRNTGWVERIQQGGKPAVVQLPKEEVELGKNQIWRDQEFILLRQKQQLARARKLDDRKIGQVPHHAIEISSNDGTSRVVVLIDKKTNLIAGMDYSEAGTDVVERYSDYKAVDGLMIAHERLTDSIQLNLKSTVDTVEVNAKIEPSIFKTTKTK